MKSILFTLLATAISFFACLAQANHDCPFSFRAHAPGDKCGFMEVPQNRKDPQSKKIKIAYLVIKSKSKNPKPDPVIFLQGGPGGTTLLLADNYSRIALDPDRDFILFDQRGIGYSDPICPDLSKEIMEVLALDIGADQEFKELSKRLLSCKAEIQKNGLDLSGYNSLENAADVEDLRKHLGYEKWNLFGGSYGSRLALTYMNLFPDPVRSTTIVGLFPPQIRMYDHLTGNFDQSISKVFSSCAKDPDCNQQYPQLKRDFFEVFKDLKAKPLTFDWNGKPFTLNAHDLLLFIHQMLYDRNSIGRIPAFIQALKNRQTNLLYSSLNLLSQRIQMINLAAYWSIMGCDEGNFNNQEKLRLDLEQHPQYEEGIGLFLSDPSMLKAWSEGYSCFTDPKAVHSDIPTLIVNGGFDPITPPSNATLAAKTLSKSYLTIFENDGHSTFNPCFFKIAREFLNNPTTSPDRECAKIPNPINWR